MVQPGYAGRVSSVVVRRPDGGTLPVAVRQGRVWPEKLLVVGERLTVELTVRRPGWVGWLVGRTAMDQPCRPDTERTTAWPLARDPPGPAGRRDVRHAGADGRVACARSRADAALRSSAHDGRRRRGRGRAAAGGKHLGQRRASYLGANAEADSVELVPGPPPRAGARRADAGMALAPDGAITVTFSRPGDDPRKEPADNQPARSWPLAPARHPHGLVPARRPRVPVIWSPGRASPEPVGLPQAAGAGDTRTLTWEVRHGTILRLQQLLAQAGYLPVEWSPAGDPVARTPHGELAATATRPRGDSAGRTRPRQRSCRRSGGRAKWNEIIRGAVMMFEHTTTSTSTRSSGRRSGTPCSPTHSPGQRTDGYSYVYVHRNVPQSLTLWHDGQDDPQLARQHGRPRGADPARHLPGLRAHPGRDDERHEPGRHPLQRSRHPLDQLLQPRRGDPRLHRARASARRRASAASSSRSPPPRRCGPTRRSGLSSRSRTESTEAATVACPGAVRGCLTDTRHRELGRDERGGARSRRPRIRQ